MKRPRVLLADDHRLVAEGLRSLLSDEFDLVGVVEDGRALVEEARKLQPEVIVADITIDLARPRRADVEDDPRFFELCTQVRHSLLQGAQG